MVLDIPAGGAGHYEILGKSNAFSLRSGLVTLNLGQNVGSHNTKDYEELIIVLDGEGEIETSSTGRKRITKGQVAYNPPWTQHDVYNTGDSPLKYIYVVARK
jgi:quercetin dioxygenase-like cupin family protein